MKRYIPNIIRYYTRILVDIFAYLSICYSKRPHVRWGGGGRATGPAARRGGDGASLSPPFPLVPTDILHFTHLISNQSMDMYTKSLFFISIIWIYDLFLPISTEDEEESPSL